MWSCDMLSSPASLCPISGEPPIHAIVGTVKEAGPAEAAQYVIGISGAIISQHEPLAMLLLILPLAYIQIATKRSKEMHEGTQRMLESMADTVDLRDPYTGGHSRRVTGLAEGILQELNREGPEVRLIVTSARLHDIGKISVPDAVLHKPGKLTDEEWAVMAAHPEVGADFLARHPGFRRA
jgi:HD-GYP domain-containing protein (c-di-GMP phosphodiesterase class II)